MPYIVLIQNSKSGKCIQYYAIRLYNIQPTRLFVCLLQFVMNCGICLFLVPFFVLLRLSAAIQRKTAQNSLSHITSKQPIRTVAIYDTCFN